MLKFCGGDRLPSYMVDCLLASVRSNKKNRCFISQISPQFQLIRSCRHRHGKNITTFSSNLHTLPFHIIPIANINELHSYTTFSKSFLSWCLAQMSEISQSPNIETIVLNTAAFSPRFLNFVNTVAKFIVFGGTTRSPPNDVR